jgi:hypothetical protein
MRSKMAFVALASVLALSGCATTSPAERRAADEARCASYGFQPETTAFSKCLLDIDLDRSADRRAALNSQPYTYWGPFFGGRYRRYW